MKFFAFLLFFVVGSGFAQREPPTALFVGSTPCDSFIRSSLGIPSGATCDFIKFRMSIAPHDGSTGIYELNVLYGPQLPNTNGFDGGGTKIRISGEYKISRGSAAIPKAAVYELVRAETKSLWLLKVDDNIFHFMDESKKLLVGDGGFGYVLNRSRE